MICQKTCKIHIRHEDISFERILDFILCPQARGRKLQERFRATSAAGVAEGPALPSADLQKHNRGRPEEADHHGQPGGVAAERPCEARTPTWSNPAFGTLQRTTSDSVPPSVPQTDPAAHLLRRVAVQRAAGRQLCQLGEPGHGHRRPLHLHAAHAQARRLGQPAAAQKGCVRLSHLSRILLIFQLPFSFFFSELKI